MLNISSWKDSFNPNEYEYTENYGNNKPDYICIGVQKGGTTSLIHYLNEHPEIFMVDHETHFFDRNFSYGKMTQGDIINYEANFSKTNKPIKGEKTPSYCYLKYAMDRIYNYDKNMKLIILLREPISRAFSQYNMNLNKSKNTLNSVSDSEILNNFINNHQNLGRLEKNTEDTEIVRGFYDEILEYILSKFPRNNVYIGISEEINENKLKYYNEIYEFLGASKLDKIPENLNTHIREYKKPIPKSLEKYLYKIYKPHNERLYKILGRRIEKWEEYYKQIYV
jgi:hypothetical protein